VKQALNDWYRQEWKDYEAWAKLHPVGEEQTEDTSLEKQREWCRMAEVRYTPTILINGYKLPELYSLEDIKYFL
jgi:protein-disulfide isomerase